MQLDILDLRDNHLSTTRLAGKFLKNTIILAWDNDLSTKRLEPYLSSKNILTQSNHEHSNRDFNPFTLLHPTQQQKDIVIDV